MKSFIRVVAVFTVAIVGLSGCGKKSDAPVKSAADFPLADPPLVADCAPGVPGGRFVIATFGDPKTFNPITENEASSQDIIRHLFSSLCGFDTPKQEVTPGLAVSWSVAPDQMTWTFKLRKGLRWSDGEPITADDVVFTFQAIYDTNCVNALADSQKIDGKPFVVSKVDDLTVQIVTPDIYAPFLESCAAGVPIIPKHILASAVAAKKFDSAYGIDTPPAGLVCSGPFTLKQYKAGELVLLERNPYFFEVDTNGTRLPYFDSVIYTIVPDMNAMSLRFLKGESDVFEYIRPDEFERFKTESAGGKFQLVELGLGLEKAFIWFNLNPDKNDKTGKPHVDPKKLKWFQQKQFRQAVSYAIDRDSIVKSIYAGRAEPSYGYVGRENLKWFNPAIKPYPFDLDKARALLADIGIKDRDGDGILEDADGNPVEYVFNTNTGNNTRDKIAVLIQSDLKKLGFKVVYQPIEFNTLVDKIDNSYDYDSVLLGLAGGGVDPVAGMNVLLSSGFTHQWYPKQKSPATPWEARVDELMNLQIKTLDFAQRKKYYDEVQTILNDQLPMIYTIAPQVYAAIRSDVGNLRPTALSLYRVTWNVEELYFKKK